MPTRRAKFKKSSSFKDLLRRREAAGLGEFSPDLSPEEGQYADDMASASERSEGSTFTDVLDIGNNSNPHLMLDGVDAAEAYPASGDRELPMFRDFNQREWRKSNDSDDDEDYPVHDQLPSAEELKIALQSRSGRNWLLRRRCSRWMWIAAVVIILILVSTIALSKTNSHGIQEKFDPTRIEQVIQLLIASGASPEISLRVTENAQRRAAVYIAAGDAYSATWPDDPDMTQRLVERFTLATIYYGLNGNHWNYRLKFLEAIDHCDWYTDFTTEAGNRVRLGVGCNDQGLITKLNLGYNNLMAYKDDTLPEELQNLKEMEMLHLHNNAIAGRFPMAVSRIPKLKSLALQYNKLDGRIPDKIGTMVQLTSLELGSNQLNGEIPQTISNLSNLRLLGLDNNDHLKGDLKSLFGGMQKLEFLYLEQNSIGGKLDDDLVIKWKEMMELDLSNNLVFGQISREILNMPNLRVLDLNTNQIDGSFPDDTLDNTVLEYFALQNNNMEGTVSDRLAFLSNLKHLDISGNKFTGTLPDTFGMMTNLKYLATTGNIFQDQKIIDLRKLTNLKSISMKNNNLVGTIPAWITELTTLELIDLDANKLTGSIPSRIGFIDNLKFLLLNRNKLTGTLPGSMALMEKLDLLLIDGNSITGNANYVCEATAVQPSVFTADCYPGVDGTPAEIKCSCCSTCCLDDDPRCNDHAWTSNYDPSWEYGFVRPTYTFSIMNAPAEYAKDQGAKEFITDQIP